MSVDFPCHVCGYDLRAQPQDGKCPECGASVAESRQWATIPRRPAWRDSDPRWRRRMLTGAWVLALLPLMDALHLSEWASRVPVPNVFGFRGVHTLDESLLGGYGGLYHSLVFCIGVVLLFTEERGRRRGPLDRARRWGVLCSYVVLVLSAVGILFIGALVMVGISALFMSMPLENHPRTTQTFVNVSWAYLRYGPHPNDTASVALIAFSSITMLLACIPLFDAMRSSGPKRLGAVLLAPLALFALVHLAYAVRYFAWGSAPTAAGLSLYELYFSPELLVRGTAGLAPRLAGPSPLPFAVFVEAAKWFAVLAVAVWLSVAQLAAWREGGKTGAASPAAGADGG